MIKDIYRGLILVSPHGTYIKDGLKTTVIKSIRLKNIHNKPLLLIENKKGLGIIELSEPKEINLDEFRKKYKQHRIKEDERLEWWKGKKILYEHKITKKKFFKKPINLNYKTGPQIVVKPENIVYDGYLNKYEKWKSIYLSLTGGLIEDKRKNVDYDKIIFRFIKHYDSAYCQIEDRIKELYILCNPDFKKKDFIPKALDAWVIVAEYKRQIQGFMFLIKIDDLFNYYKDKKIDNPKKKLEEHTGNLLENRKAYYVGYICENSFKYENIINSMFRFFFNKEFKGDKNKRWFMNPVKLDVLRELADKNNNYYLHVKPENIILADTYELYGFKPTNKKYKNRNIYILS